MADRQTEQAAGRKRGNLASNLFAAAAIVFAILAVVLYLRESRGGIAPIPTAEAGSNQIVNVTEALKAQRLDVKQPPGLFIPVGAFDVPGQGIEVNGQPGFVFLFENAAAAGAAAEGADLESIVPDRLAGTPAPPGERRLVQHSNVIVLLAGGDDETWQKVQDAVAGLA